MKTRNIIALATVLLALPLGAAELSAQRGISILFVNGQTAESKIGTNQIDEGFAQAVVKFDGKIGHGASAEIFESKPYVLNFDAQGSEFEIKLPKFNSAVSAQKAFETQNPGWQVLVDGKPVKVKHEMLKGKTGFMPYAGMENLIAEHNKQRGVYFKSGQVVEAPVAAEVVSTAAASSKQSVASAVATKNVEQLKAWYLQASKEERKQFRRWMIDQE